MQYVPPIGATDPNASYVEGDPTAGIRGSYPTAAGYEAMMREICNAALLSGQVANPNDFTQTFQAMASGGIWVGTFGYTAATTGTSPTPETYTAALPAGGVIPTLTSLRTGTRLIGFVPTASATTSPVLAFTGVGSGPVQGAVKKVGGAAPAIGDVQAALVAFRFDGTSWRIDGLAPSDIVPPISDAQVWHTGAAGGTSTAITTTLTPAPAHGASGFFIGLSAAVGFSSGADATLSWESVTGSTITVPLVNNTTGAPVTGGEVAGPPSGEAETASETQIFYDGTVAKIMNSAPRPIFFGSLSGTNTLTATIAPAVPSMSAIPDGSVVILVPGAANTSNVTVNGMPLLYVDGVSQLLPDELSANQPVVTVKLGSNLLFRSPTNPARSATLASSNNTQESIAEGTFTAYPLGTASAVFCSISGTSITIEQPGIYVANGTLTITQTNNTAGSNYNWDAMLTLNGSAVPGGFGEVGNFGQGTQTANLSANATFSAVAGDVLNLLGEADCTSWGGGYIGSGSISITKLV